MKFFRNNGLSICFFFLFVLALIGQAWNGHIEYNEGMKDLGGVQVSIWEYLGNAHFWEATMENFESEFLQMGLFVWFTTFLYQKGSSESKDPDKEERVDREPSAKRKDVPWPVKKGGWVLGLYKYSLSIVLLVLFIICFTGHWLSSLHDYNHEQLLKGGQPDTAFAFLGHSRLWFESFENWQSEFLSVFAIVILSIYLRHKGSPQSKPVDAPHTETGE